MTPETFAADTVRRLAYEVYCKVAEPHRAIARRAGIDVRTMHRALDPDRASAVSVARLALIAWAAGIDMDFKIIERSP